MLIKKINLGFVTLIHGTYHAHVEVILFQYNSFFFITIWSMPVCDMYHYVYLLWVIKLTWISFCDWRVYCSAKSTTDNIIPIGNLSLHILKCSSFHWDTWSCWKKCHVFSTKSFMKSQNHTWEVTNCYFFFPVLHKYHMSHI